MKVLKVIIFCCILFFIIAIVVAIHKGLFSKPLSWAPKIKEGFTNEKTKSRSILTVFIVLLQFKDYFKDISFQGRDEINEAFRKLENEETPKGLNDLYDKIFKKIKADNSKIFEPTHTVQIITAFLRHICKKEKEKTDYLKNSEFIKNLCIVYRNKNTKEIISRPFLSVKSDYIEQVSNKSEHLIYKGFENLEKDHELLNVPEIVILEYVSSNESDIPNGDFVFDKEYIFEIDACKEKYYYELNSVAFSVREDIEDNSGLSFIIENNEFVCNDNLKNTKKVDKNLRKQPPYIMIYKRIN